MLWLLGVDAVGLSALQYVDLRSSRNLYIIGLSIFFPLVLCQWMQKNPGAIDTGIKELDGTLSVLLGTTILVGGFLGCFLDNIIPGKMHTIHCNCWCSMVLIRLFVVHVWRRYQGRTWSHCLGKGDATDRWWDNKRWRRQAVHLWFSLRNGSAATVTTTIIYQNDFHWYRYSAQLNSSDYSCVLFRCKWTSHIPFMPTYRPPAKKLWAKQIPITHTLDVYSHVIGGCGVPHLSLNATIIMHGK